MDFALLLFIERLNRHELDPVACPGKGEQHFGFDLEMLGGEGEAAKDRQVAQVTLHTKHAILRAEEASSDMFASIDAVLEKMQRQIDHYKGKRWNKRLSGVLPMSFRNESRSK